MDIQNTEELLSAIRLLVTEDPCSGRFVFGRQELQPKKLNSLLHSSFGRGGDNPKNELQTLLTRAGHDNPAYKTKQIKGNQFRATVEFNGREFVGQPCNSKKLAEKNAASDALEWLIGETSSGGKVTRDIDQVSMLLKGSRRKHRRQA